ncbi:unnamed protein product [Lactuca virosa]|uniref:Uncharacterized protein n=1 Tax=Lactuca virosa TaxID=75947 RepID=A0AAU9NFL7_9ASTR|nr:unnamed protein product [Lactuca virosa]
MCVYHFEISDADRHSRVLHRVEGTSDDRRIHISDRGKTNRSSERQIKCAPAVLGCLICPTGNAKERGGVRRSFVGRTSVIDNHGSSEWGVQWSRSHEEGKASPVLGWTEKKRNKRMEAAVNHRRRGKHGQ